MFVYSDTGPKTPSGYGSHFNFANPNRQWRTHKENEFLLEFIGANSTDFREKRQVEKELEICRRKLKWWSERGGFSQEQMRADVADLKTLWASKRAA